MSRSLTKRDVAGRSFPWHRMRHNAIKSYPVRNGAHSRLTKDFSANNVMVRGHGKVTQHLMFGIIALLADQLLRLR